MTQPPLGTNQHGTDPFDQTRPGQPDVTASEFARAQEKYADVPASEADNTVAYGGRSHIATTTSGSGFDDTTSSGESKVDTAKGEAKQVAGTAVDSGKQVAATAKEEAGNVAAEAKQQAASLFDTVRSEAGSQASTQQQRIAEALHSLSKELGGMASSSEESGPLTDLAHQASRKGGEVAHWLQDREPTDVLDAVRSYARRRPATFLAICGLAGVAAGRLTRSTVANRTSLDSKDDTGHGGDRRDVERRSNYLTPATEPTGYPATGVSTGVYAGSVESTGPADPGYPTQAPVAGSGYVGTTDPVDESNR